MRCLGVICKCFNGIRGGGGVVGCSMGRLYEGSALAVLLLLGGHAVLVDAYVGVGRFGALALDELLLDGLADGVEDLGDIVVVLGAALHELHSVLLGERSALCEGDLAFVLLAVDLVADDDLAHGLGLRLVDLLDPVLQVLEGLLIGDGVDQDDSCCAFIVGFGDGLEAFLAGSVPDLHLDLDAVDVNGLYLEVHADGGDVRHLVLLVHVAQQDVGLAHRRVPDYHQLHQVVVALVVPTLCHYLRFDYTSNQQISSHAPPTTTKPHQADPHMPNHSLFAGNMSMHTCADDRCIWTTKMLYHTFTSFWCFCLVRRARCEKVSLPFTVCRRNYRGDKGLFFEECSSLWIQPNWAGLDRSASASYYFQALSLFGSARLLFLGGVKKAGLEWYSGVMVFTLVLKFTLRQLRVFLELRCGCCCAKSKSSSSFCGWRFRVLNLTRMWLSSSFENVWLSGSSSLILLGGSSFSLLCSSSFILLRWPTWSNTSAVWCMSWARTCEKWGGWYLLSSICCMRACILTSRW